MTDKRKKGAPILQVADPTKEELATFEFKNDFLLNNPYFSYKEIGLEDFLDKIFVRPKDKGRWPFEAEQCDAYKLWRKKYDEGLRQWEESGHDVSKYVPDIDYSDMPEFRSNPIIFYFSPKLKKGTDEEIWNNRGVVCEPKRILVLKEAETDDTLSYDLLDPVRGSYFAIISPVTFIGHHRTLQNARWCYGITVDLDYVGEREMDYTIFWQTKIKTGQDRIEQLLPVANIITNSGHGVHLYFLFENPIDIHLETQRNLVEKLKYGLTQTCWKLTYTTKADKLGDIQYQGIIQGYRVPESLTKFKRKVRSFYNENSKYFTIRELSNFVGQDSKYKLSDEEITSLESGIPYNPDRVTLAEAKKRWPEWYQERIVEGRPPKEWQSRRQLYDYWVRLILSDTTPISVGHRYYCLRFIAVLGRKCGVPRQEVENTIMSQIQRMDGITTQDEVSNHFLESDAKAAFDAYDDAGSMKVSWKYIVAKSGLSSYIAEEKIKNPQKISRRNGRKQAEHLQRARAIRDIDHPEGSWINKEGRAKGSFVTCEESPAARRIAEWRKLHPESTNKSACARDLKLDRKTVWKWWKNDDSIAEKQWQKQQQRQKPAEIKNHKALPDDPYEGFIKEDADGLLLINPSMLKSEEDYKKATKLLQEAIKKLRN